ncbi:MAG: LysR family transcriptional regulator [Bacteroidota bacterium]
MEIRHLRLIESVAEEGSLTRAVKKLNVSPSALSHQLKEVEQEVGVQLFSRVNKKLVITDAGRVMLKSAQKILHELKSAEHELISLRDGQVGELNITTECYTCYHWLPGVMKTFSREFPGVNVNIHPDFTADPIPHLLEGRVDGVLTSEIVNNNGIIYRELFRDELVAVVALGHPWEDKLYVVAEDFADQNVLIYSRPLETVSLFRQVLIPANVTPRKITEILLTEAQVEMVKTGNYVKVLAKWAVEPYLKTQPIVTIPVTKNGLHRTWYFAMLKKATSAPYMDKFIQLLARQMRSGV